jgi:hydroxymethylbilane synthase
VLTELKIITVAARGSPLSRVQCVEVLDELRRFHPYIEFKIEYVNTTGDKDRVTSLKTLDKSCDFFTKEIDEIILNEQARIAIHSAKDLPDPLAEGLTVIALTKGVDPSDSLVLPEGINLDQLPIGAKIATSSIRREEMIREICPHARIVDIRGNIEERIAKMQRGEVDGVIIAEAALIRLKLHHLNRVKLKGPTAALQGQLAVVASVNDVEMDQLFEVLDVRREKAH